MEKVLTNPVYGYIITYVISLGVYAVISGIETSILIPAFNF